MPFPLDEGAVDLGLNGLEAPFDEDGSIVLNRLDFNTASTELLWNKQVTFNQLHQKGKTQNISHYFFALLGLLPKPCLASAELCEAG